jgi:hypothetical protein
MNWIELIKVIPAIIQMVIELVTKFEVPGASGTQKKQAVLDVVKASSEGLDQCGIKAPLTVILTVADRVIDLIVAGFNVVGIFKKAEPTPPAA